jgi:hypothetical protein
MSEQSAKMTYRLPDGTETTYLVELQPESDYSIMDKKFYLAGIEAENERIIKLLEAPYFHHTFFGARGVDDESVILHDGECIGCKAITFIKAENK